MKKLIKNICLLATLVLAATSCVENDPEYTTFPSKDVDFKYCVAANEEGVVEYALDYYVVSTIQFTNTSAKTGNVTWDFGDGNTSNEQNPLHKYDKAGTYKVTLKVDGVGTAVYPIMIYDIAPVLSIKEQSADILVANDVTVDFDIFLPNPENLKVKYEWSFPEGTMNEAGEELTSFTGYADENGNVDYPGKLKFRNIGSQKISIKTTFDLDGENRTLEDSYVNVQVGSPVAGKTLYYAVYGGNIKAIKLIDESLLPEGTKVLPFDLGVKSGTTPMNLVFTELEVADENSETGKSKAGYLYVLDCGKQYTYINDENGVYGDGKITVMNPDGTGTNVFVTNVGQGAFYDPFFGCVDGTDLIYSDRNTGLRKTDLKERGKTEANDYLLTNDYLGYYSRSSLGFGAISCTILKDSKGTYWWGKCYNGNGIFRFKASDIIYYKDAKGVPNKVILENKDLKCFMIDENRKALYVFRTKDADSGFYAYALPEDNEDVTTPTFKLNIEADAVNATADEGLYCTQMALDAENGNIYFGFNKGKTDSSKYATGLYYYTPGGKDINATVVTDKVLGVAINDNKTKLF